MHRLCCISDIGRIVCNVEWVLLKPTCAVLMWLNTGIAYSAVSNMQWCCSRMHRRYAIEQDT